jgi:hypothetical protein
MQWVVITKESLNDYLVAAQVDALSTAALDDAQSDPFERVMPNVANRIRKKVESSPRMNLVSATANAVPPELVGAACVLTIQAMQGRIPSLRLTPDQTRLIDQAEADLKAIAKGEEVVSTPDDPVEGDVQTGGSITVVSTITRRATRQTMDGI